MGKYVDKKTVVNACGFRLAQNIQAASSIKTKTSSIATISRCWIDIFLLFGRPPVMPGGGNVFLKYVAPAPIAFAVISSSNPVCSRS